MAVIPLSLLFVVLGSGSVPVTTESNVTILPCELTPARVDLGPDVQAPRPIACVSPNTATVIVFHTRIAPLSVALQGQDYFKVSASPESILLIPKGNIPTGQTFQLSVRFPDGAAPTAGAIDLLVDQTVTTRQLDVYRRARTVEEYQKDARDAVEEAGRLRSLLKEKEQTCEVLGGLAGLIVSGLLQKRGMGAMTHEATPKGGGAPVMMNLYRLPGKRVAIKAKIENPWYFGVQIADAVLTDNLGTTLQRVAFWTNGKASPDTQVVVEWSVDERLERRTFTLKLAVDGVAAPLLFEDIRFP